MSRAPVPSFVILPECEPPYPSLLDFLDHRFGKVGRDVWRARIESGKVTDKEGRPVTRETPYRPRSRIYYYREVESEPEIPFEEKILFRNDHILAACKPHFLPVTPSGPYVNQCLLYRIRTGTGINDLAPLHRIDRETAGIVLFSVNRKSRGLYHELFTHCKVHKIYEAIGAAPADRERREWFIESRIVRGEPWVLSKEVEGTVNARTSIRLLEIRGDRARFHLEPLTGKKHQLRLHLGRIGSWIVNDPLYPEFKQERKEGWDNPLQLLARSIGFIDPVSGKEMRFCSTRRLEW